MMYCTCTYVQKEVLLFSFLSKLRSLGERGQLHGDRWWAVLLLRCRSERSVMQQARPHRELASGILISSSTFEEWNEPKSLLPESGCAAIER